MSEMDLFLDRIEDIAVKTAYREHKDCPGIDTDDVAQHVRVQFYRKFESIKDWDEAGLWDLARKVARSYVAKERVDYMEFSGTFIYNREIVQLLLTDAVWCEVEDSPSIEGRIDVAMAYEKLPLRQRRLLFRRYGLGEKLDNASADRKATDRAVARIVQELNSNLNLGFVSLDEVNDYL